MEQADIERIARASAQAVLEGLHRYATEYKQPGSVAEGLQESIVEESTAVDWYRKRAKHASDDSTTAALYMHIADEEADHIVKFRNRLAKVKEHSSIQSKRPTRADVKVVQWAERDRHHIGIVDKETEQVSYADWWDDDARQMFEDGFFVAGNDFENSVLGYAEDMGFIGK